MSNDLCHCGHPPGYHRHIVWNKKYAHPSSHYIWDMFYRQARVVNSFATRPPQFIEYSFVTAGPELCTRY